MENVSLKSLIDRAIQREEEAHAFYTDLHERVADVTAKEALKFLAGEESKHRDFLVSYRDGASAMRALAMDERVDYGIAQHLETPDIRKDLSTSEVYLVAAHRELSSYTFYTELAALQPAGEVRDTLQRMAGEEMKHKEKVEYLFANTAFPQTEGG
jgi:rubrerythrin